MCVYMYIYIYIYLYIIIYIYIYTHRPQERPRCDRRGAAGGRGDRPRGIICICMCMFICMCICMCMFICMCICMCILIFICMCMCIFICIVYLCVYLYFAAIVLAVRPISLLRLSLLRLLDSNSPSPLGKHTAQNCTIQTHHTANLRTRILDFRGLDSSIILILRGGILMSMENFPESFSQAILVGIILVGRLGVTNMLASAVVALVVSGAATHATS